MNYFFSQKSFTAALFCFGFWGEITGFVVFFLLKQQP